jgi:hypothetical protein
MADFPRAMIEDLSVSRMIAGTNWFLGFSHQTRARDEFIKSYMTRERMADILEVFLRAGIDAHLGVRPESPHHLDAIRDAEERVGREIITMGTPTLKWGGRPEDDDENRRILDAYAAIGCSICMPHQQTTDALLDRVERKIRLMDEFCAMIRQRGMIPGLSTHMPETPRYADRTGLDVATYIQIYNARGFLMQIEIDWVHKVIHEAAKPVICIKPMAAGRVQPLVGLAFVWATIRPQDMVCVGTMTPDEARELIEITWSLFENRASTVELQRTRSKTSLEAT